MQEIKFEAVACHVVESGGDHVIFTSTSDFDAKVHAQWAAFNKGAAPSLRTARGNGVAAARAMGWVGDIQVVDSKGSRLVRPGEKQE